MFSDIGSSLCDRLPGGELIVIQFGFPVCEIDFYDFFIQIDLRVFVNRSYHRLVKTVTDKSCLQRQKKVALYSGAFDIRNWKQKNRNEETEEKN